MCGGLAIVAYLMFTFGVLDRHSNPNQIYWDSSKLANDTASKYGIFHDYVGWDIYVSADGKIQSVDGTWKNSQKFKLLMLVFYNSKR